MSNITNDLARYRRRVNLAAAPQREVTAPDPAQREHVLACLARGNPNGYTDFSLAASQGHSPAK